MKWTPGRRARTIAALKAHYEKKRWEEGIFETPAQTRAREAGSKRAMLSKRRARKAGRLLDDPDYKHQYSIEYRARKRAEKLAAAAVVLKERKK